MPRFSSDQIAPVLQGTNKLVWFCKLKRLEKFPNPKPSPPSPPRPPRTPHPDGMKVSLEVITSWENVAGIHKYFRGGKRGGMKSLAQEILFAWPMRSSNHRPSLTLMQFAVSLIRVGIRVCPNNYTEFSSCSFFFESFQKIPQSDDIRRTCYKIIIIKQRIQKEYRRGNKLALKALQHMVTAIDWINHYPVDRY